jgi:arylsulfatase A-like enzyme
MKRKIQISRYLFLPAIFLLAPLGIISCRREPLPPFRPNIILISFDTLRADRLSCYGYSRLRTPAFDALARDGFLFRNASTQFPETRQSHMTIMTSVYPSVHGLTQKRGEWEDRRMNPKLQPLSVFLKEAGYYNIGITEGCFVAGAMGFSRGFDEYYDRRLGAEKIFAQADDWLRENRKKRFFLFLHTYETHVPYDPPLEFLPLPPAEYSWEEKMAGSWEYYDRVRKGKLKAEPDSPEFLKKLNQLYDGEVAYADQELGKLVKTLKELNLYEGSLLIVLSDHG